MMVGCGCSARPDLPQSDLPMMRSFTFLRMTPEMLQPAYQTTWARFMHRMCNNSVRPQPGAGPAAGAAATLMPPQRG
jgi:hypothetical protein